MMAVAIIAGAATLEAKTTRKKSSGATSSSSQTFTAKTIFNSCLESQKNLGSSLEKAGFKMKSQRNTQVTYDDGGTYISAKDITYEKNGIIISYIYVPSEKTVDTIVMNFPDKSSLNSFVKSFKDYCRSLGHRLESEYAPSIEFGTCHAYGQITCEGLELSIIWI